MEIVKVVKNENDLLETLKGFSLQYGGAFVFVVKPFTHEVTFVQFANPSSVPDSFHDLTHNTMAHRGKLRGFTNGAKRREQNRGLGRG